MRLPTALTAVLVVGALLASASAQTQVTKETVPGVTNFARAETTVACGGATGPEAMPHLKKMGFNSVINLREADEAGANVPAEEAAAKASGLNFVHIPFRTASPAPGAVDHFLKAVTTQANQPAYIHCGGGSRAAGLWMIKRILIDKWDVARATTEAEALGLTNPSMKQFALAYIDTHKP